MLAAMARRRLLTTLLLGLLVVTGCGTDDSGRAPNVDATLLLAFPPNAAPTGIYMAAGRGYDTALGVTLRVRVPTDSTDAVKLLVSRTADLAVLHIHALALDP